MLDIDWTDLQLYHYMAMGGGALALLAVVLYFILPRGFKIPAGIISTVAALIAGVGVGVVGMASFGYQTLKPGADVEKEAGAPVPGGPQVKGKGPGMGGGMGGGFGGGKPKTPSIKPQLVQLVGKIQRLTDTPLTLKLSDEQRTAIQAQLKGLAELEELTEADAKSRFDAIVEAVKGERKTLEAVGFRWPGAGGVQAPPVSMPNPFQEGEDKDRLVALQGNLNKK